jgi:hypothetical protein
VGWGWGGGVGGGGIPGVLLTRWSHSHTTKRQGLVCPGFLDCLVICCCNMEKNIFSEEKVLEQIKPKSRKAYKKCWKELKEFKELNPEINFEESPWRGIELVPVPAPVPGQTRIESIIRPWLLCLL